jgi:hypothetical protein
MTTTTFASPFFDDSNDGFTAGERVRVITGEHAGKFGEIDTVFTNGYYLVSVDGVPATLVFEYNHIEPLIEPVLLPKFLPAPAYGMTCAALADEVSEAITRATGRVVGVGQEQYDLGDSQKFERMDLADLIEGALEELDDVIVYSVRVGIRFRRILDGLKDVL